MSVTPERRRPRPLRPETLMVGLGHDPARSEGALKPPIHQTSTFVFETAEQGKRFFEVAYGLRQPEVGERIGQVYSRIGNPTLDLLEERLRVWDGADRALAFASGMAAIGTTLFAHLRPGDVLLHSVPMYGGTDHLAVETLPGFGIRSVEVTAEMDRSEIEGRLDATHGRLGLVLLETPANPTNDLFDIELFAAIAADRAAGGRRAPVAVDNTFLGPLWQRPMEHGADLVLYSATKYLGGHSDLIAGVASGTAEAVQPVAELRSFLGTMAGPHTAWMLLRSLETLGLRMARQTETAARVARFLADHPKVRTVHYLGLLDAGDPAHDLYKRQCLGPGAMISFEVEGGEGGAFRFLDALGLVKLAVSLGGTESLAEHPATMTHAGCDPGGRLRHGITEGLVRLSVGIEHPEDLIADVARALDAI
ncbi:MAG TPA: cystathionine gamma-synthase family protein [Actinomycetota bacterium]|nr:cystathionine gamma-synthase family protein [Actinomycetota bacterium]